MSVVTVIAGHWAISINHWSNGVIRSTSAIGVTPGLWLATWLFQVIPLFFFVGGVSNYWSYRSTQCQEGSRQGFLSRRMRRLLLPFAVYFGVWVVVQIALHLFDIGAPAGPRLWDSTALLRGMRPPGATIPFGPLWFLAVYVVIVFIAPVMIKLHERLGVWILGSLFAAAICVDALRFVAGLSWFGYFNIGFVFLLFHQVGFFYADRSLLNASRRLHVCLAGGGLFLMVVLTNPQLFRAIGDVGPRWFNGMSSYPRSLMGTDVEPLTNTYPPTLVFLAMGLWVIGALMLLRPLVIGWLERPRLQRATNALNRVVMSLYLWHMTAYLLAIILLWPLGLGRETRTTWRWWVERPLWVAVPGLLLSGLVITFAAAEALGRRRVDS